MNNKLIRTTAIGGHTTSSIKPAPPWTQRLGIIESSNKQRNKTLTQPSLKLLGTVCKKQCEILIDCGATGDFSSVDFIKRNKLEDHCILLDPPLIVQLADGKRLEARTMLKSAAWCSADGELTGMRDLPVLPLHGYDIIFGMPWLKELDPSISWRDGSIHKKSTPAILNSIDQQNQLKSNHTKVTEALTRVSPKIAALLSTYIEVFPDELPDGLPMERPIEHKIKLKPDSLPVAQKQYRLSVKDMAEIERQCQAALKAKKIRPSTSSFNAPSLLTPKPEPSDARWCNDYRGVNAVTEKDKISMPITTVLFDHVGPNKFFTKIDLRQGFNQVRIAPEDVHKTAFSTSSGHYEWLVLPFGLCNAPATFQRLMQFVLADRLYKSVIVFIDDILIYSNTEEDHLQNVEWVLSKLKQWQLYASIKKCEWMKDEVEFLGHKISAKGVSVLPGKIKAIVEWPELQNAKELRSFLGLAGYYRKFVEGFSRIAAPLTELTKDQRRWQWGEEQRSAFNTLKQALSSTPVLVRPDPEKPFTVTTDASGFAVGAVLTQEDDQGHQRPIAYMSHKMLPAERNYPVHEQELLAIVSALKEWRYLLHGNHLVTIITDHMSLKYLNSQPFLSARQARWVEFLQDFDIVITHRAGKENVAADALSRRGDHRRAAEVEDEEKKTSTDTSKVQRIPFRLAPMTSIEQNGLMEEIKAATERDAALQPIAADPEQYGYTLTDGLLKNQQGCVVIPADRSIRTRILQEVHDAPTGGHLGMEKTLTRLGKLFWWEGIRAETQQYVGSCVACQSNKASNQKPAGLLHSLPIPTRRWEQVSMDFVGPLPATKRGNDFILVVVDKLSKMVHLIPCRTTITAKQVASLFWREIIRLHGMPSSIVSDRDPRFTSHFWQELWKLMGTKLAMSTAYHPQTDGQTERVNRVMEEILRSYVDDSGTDWDEHITGVEIAINNSKHSSTEFSPFYLNSGQDPLLPLEQAVNSAAQTDNPAVADCLHSMHEDIERAKKNIQKAQVRQAHYADQHRRKADEFVVGDRVMLSTDHLVRFGSKLTSKYVGPFRIKHVLADKMVELELPVSMKLKYPRFNISKVKMFRTTKLDFPGREQLDRPLPVLVDGEEEYEVEEIVGKENMKVGRSTVTRYLVKWKGYDMSESTWQKEEDLANASEAIELFEQQQEE